MWVGESDESRLFDIHEFSGPQNRLNCCACCGGSSSCIRIQFGQDRTLHLNGVFPDRCPRMSARHRPLGLHSQVRGNNNALHPGREQRPHARTTITFDQPRDAHSLPQARPTHKHHCISSVFDPISLVSVPQRPAARGHSIEPAAPSDLRSDGEASPNTPGCSHRPASSGMRFHNYPGNNAAVCQ